MKTISMLAILVLALALPARAQMGGSSVTGTVVTVSADNLVVRTATGEMSFKMAATVDRPANLAAGSQVTVMYTPPDPGYGNQNVATKITMAGATSAEQPKSQTPMSSEPTTQTPAAQESRQPAERTSSAGGTKSEELPATASPLPLLGLLGLTSLGVGFAMRWNRSSR